MENLKIITAQKAASRMIPNEIITFTSLDNQSIGDYFTVKYEDKVYNFKVMNIIASDEEFLIISAEGKEGRRTFQDLDFRNFIGLPVEKVVDEERLKVLIRAESLC